MLHVPLTHSRISYYKTWANLKVFLFLFHITRAQLPVKYEWRFNKKDSNRYQYMYWGKSLLFELYHSFLFSPALNLPASAMKVSALDVMSVHHRDNPHPAPPPHIVLKLPVSGYPYCENHFLTQDHYALVTSHPASQCTWHVSLVSMVKSCNPAGILFQRVTSWVTITR